MVRTEGQREQLGTKAEVAEAPGVPAPVEGAMAKEDVAVAEVETTLTTRQAAVMNTASQSHIIRVNTLAIRTGRRQGVQVGQVPPTGLKTSKFREARDRLQELTDRHPVMSHSTRRRLGISHSCRQPLRSLMPYSATWEAVTKVSTRRRLWRALHHLKRQGSFQMSTEFQEKEEAGSNLAPHPKTRMQRGSYLLSSRKLVKTLLTS